MNHAIRSFLVGGLLALTLVCPTAQAECLDYFNVECGTGTWDNQCNDGYCESSTNFCRQLSQVTDTFTYRTCLPDANGVGDECECEDEQNLQEPCYDWRRCGESFNSAACPDEWECVEDENDDTIVSKLCKIIITGSC